MATLRVGSFVLVVGCCATACGGQDDLPSDTYVSSSTGNANAAVGTTGGAVTTVGGDSTTGGVPQGTGGATTGGATTGGATTGGAGAGGATTGGVVTAGAGTGGATTGGATTGGDPNCFPPVTDFAAEDGGFDSAEREIVEVGGGDSVSIFRPSDANFGQDGCQHPLLVWGNGSTMEVDSVARHLSRAATFGFVVVAPEQTQVNSGHMDAALDHVIGLSQDSSSNYYNKVNASKLGSTGFSLGGAGAMQVAANARIGATFIWDSFGNCSALHGPMGGIFAEEGIGGGIDIVDDCPYASFAMQVAGTTHTSILSYPGGFGSGSTPYAQESYVAWFRWHFMGDPAAEALFVGESCGFCIRDGVTVKTNGID